MTAAFPGASLAPMSSTKSLSMPASVRIERGAHQGAGAEADGRADGPAEHADEAARDHSAKGPDRFRVRRSPHHDFPAGLLHHDGVVVQRERALSVHVVQGASALVGFLFRIEADKNHSVHNVLSFTESIATVHVGTASPSAPMPRTAARRMPRRPPRGNRSSRLVPVCWLPRAQRASLPP